MKAIKGLAVLLLVNLVAWLVVSAILSIFIGWSVTGFIVGYFINLAVIVVSLKRVQDNMDVAAITKATCNAELNDEEFGKLISMTEIKGYKYKTSSVKRTYLFFGNYVYTIKFTKA